jgi:hypothetical protein
MKSCMFNRIMHFTCTLKLHMKSQEVGMFNLGYFEDLIFFISNSNRGL